MKYLYTLVFVLVGSVFGIEQTTSLKKLSRLQEQLATISFQRDIDRTPHIYNLLDVSDFLQLSEQCSVREGDLLVLYYPPDLRTPQTYSYCGVAKHNPQLTPYPENPLHYFYKVPSSKEPLHIYHQYQRCEDGVMVPPTNEFSVLTIIPRSSPLEEYMED